MVENALTLAAQGSSGTATATSNGNLAQQMNLTYQTALSNDQDADMAQAATQLTESQTQEQAALQAEGMLPRNSLFNFLG